MKKKKYIQPASFQLSAPLLLQPAQLSGQDIGNNPGDIGGQGDPGDGGDAKNRLWETEEYNIPNSLW